MQKHHQEDILIDFCGTNPDVRVEVDLCLRKTRLNPTYPVFAGDHMVPNDPASGGDFIRPTLSANPQISPTMVD
jgi:hypothetical protein